MNIEKMLGAIAGGGWDDLENVGDRFAKMAREQGEAERQEIERQAAIVHAALSTEEGAQLLDLLLQFTLMRQPEDNERTAVTADAYAIAKAKREGQNSIVFLLLARLQQARGQEVKKQTGGEL